MPSVAEIPNRPPKVSTTPKWRAAMKVAREAAGLTQAELGAATGVSQPVIQGLEKGSLSSSKAVLRICELLRIPPPQRYQDATEERWAAAGAQLRSLKPAVFASQLKAIEEMVKDFVKDLEKSDDR